MERTRRTRKELLDFVCNEIESLGVKIPPSSRWGQIKRLYEAAEGSLIPKDHPDYQFALEAERDVQMMAFVFDHIGDLKADPEFLVQLKKTVQDSPLPQEDRENSDGRNAQFHLYLAAICKKADMVPRFAEPDLICHSEKTAFAVAAKRIKNIDRLEERIRSARDQIVKAKLPGVIILDITLAINRENARPDLPYSDDDFVRLCQRELNAFIDTKIEKIRQMLRGTEVRGIILEASIVVHSADAKGEPTFIALTHGVPTVQHNRSRQLQFDRFRHNYDLGLYNPQNGAHRVPPRRR